MRQERRLLRLLQVVLVTNTYGSLPNPGSLPMHMLAEHLAEHSTSCASASIRRVT